MAKGIVGAVFGATAVAGTLDIAYALVAASLQGTAPHRVLQYIASGVLGRAAFQGGAGSAALGLALHYLIMLGMAAAFVFASLWLGVLRERPILMGGLYGLFLYGFMRFVVVPASRVTPGPAPELWPALGQIAAHVLLVGVTIGYFARRAQQP